jgi:hypothetical protein
MLLGSFRNTYESRILKWLAMVDLKECEREI